MSATGHLPLDFLCPAGNHQHHRAIEKPSPPPPPQQQQQQQQQQQCQRQPHTKHLPPGLPGAVEGHHHHHHHHHRQARTPASSSSSSSDAGDGSTPQQAISTYLRRISQAAEALAAAADQEDHALRADGVLPSDGNLLVMEAICRETVSALRAVRQCNRAVAIAAAAASSSASPSPSPGGRTADQVYDDDDDDVMVTSSTSSINPRKRLLSPPPHLRRHRRPAPTTTTATTAASSSSTDSSAAAAAAEAKGAAAAAGAAPPRPRRRRHACTQCGCTETPFWRHGPLGSRSLCNVCGLLYARRARDRREASRGRTLQWAGGASEGGDLTSWRSSGGSSGSLFP